MQLLQFSLTFFSNFEPVPKTKLDHRQNQTLLSMHFLLRTLKKTNAPGSTVIFVNDQIFYFCKL